MLPLSELPLLFTDGTQRKGAMRHRRSPALAKSVSFSETKLNKRRVEMLAAVAVQAWSQNSDLKPLKSDAFLDQCLLTGLMDVGPEELDTDGPMFDPLGLDEEEEARMSEDVSKKSKCLQATTKRIKKMRSS